MKQDRQQNRQEIRDKPSFQDILVSGNLERLLYLIESDGGLVRALMDELKSEGRYAVPDEYRRAIAGAFYADWANEEACRREIRRMWFEEGILIDPHTAVAMCAARRWLREEGGGSACVVLSTASPYKFPGTVLSCLQDGAEPCPRAAECGTLPVWKGLERVINGYLDGITLQDILDQKKERDASDYVI